MRARAQTVEKEAENLQTDEMDRDKIAEEIGSGKAVISNKGLKIATSCY
jgi:hypothetical protein